MIRAAPSAGALIVLIFLVTASAAAQQKPPSRAKPVPPPKQTSPTATTRAQENYRATCVPCHGAEGKGVIPNSNLADGEWKNGSSMTAIARVIREGVKGTVMVPFKDRFTEAEILDLARLVRSFQPRAKPGKTPPK